MRGFQNGSLSRLAILALVTSSLAGCLVLDVTSASARTGGAAGTAGGATGGSTGGGASGGGAGNPLAAIEPIRGPRFVRIPSDPRGQSCYQSQPMFDRWGDYVGKQQQPDFCY